MVGSGSVGVRATEHDDYRDQRGGVSRATQPPDSLQRQRARCSALTAIKGTRLTDRGERRGYRSNGSASRS